MMLYEGNTYVVFKDDISEKLWQELKDSRPLITEDSFKPKDGGCSYSTFETPETFTNTSTVLLGTVFILGVAIVIAFAVSLIYLVIN